MPVKILVIDDEPNLQPLVRQIFRKQIGNNEYRMEFAVNGLEALAQLKSHPDIDIILSDINMPDMDGLTLLAKIAEMKPTLNPVLTPVIVSAYDDMENIRRAMNNGAFDFLTKPIDPQDLRITVQKTVQHVAQLKLTIDREQQAKEMLRSINQELEERVQIRTAELEAANEALRISNAELDAFAHTVAHDLKGSLSIMSGFAELLNKKEIALSPAELTRAYSIIHNTSKKSINIVDELLLMAGVRKEDVILVPIDSGLILQQVQERLALMINEYKGQIEMPASWPSALGYEPWVEEIWVNFISNGLKYGGNPPQLTLGASPHPNGTICFWVKDNGPGISPQDQPRLFTEFTRLDKLRGDGQGLGLSIAKRIAEKLGGQVGVKSALGQGSTFYFTLKAA